MIRLRVPILTYHSANISGGEYLANDHVAFASDLRQLTALGWKVASLDSIVRAVVAGGQLPGEKGVGISLDDGTDFDFVDLEHPTAGLQRSIFGIVADFMAVHASLQPWMHVTSFVIVSPEARRELDRTCLVGLGWWNDGWWGDAIASGRWAIANHSWDHNHLGLARTVLGDAPKGTFHVVDDYARAEAEIATGATFLQRRFGAAAGASLFAYPYGESTPYLVSEYLPRHAAATGTAAAFGSEGMPVTEGSNRWLLPRYVFGHHWKSPAELTALLRDIAP